MVKKFEHIAHKYPEGSVGENFFHFLGEVEAVFGLWALFLFVAFIAIKGNHDAVAYLEGHSSLGVVNYTEPAFVFVIMCMAGTRPVIKLAENIIVFFAKLLPFNEKMSFYATTMVMGPLLGSFITEPASMTVTALILLETFYKKEMSDKFKYATIGLLFVNVSIGGTLTHFAAPPVLMVASKWGYTMSYMFLNFGYKAIFACIVSTAIITMRFKGELQGKIDAPQEGGAEMKAPLWVTAFHLGFLGLVVFYSHHMAVFMGIFLFFLGFAVVTQEYQDKLKVTESLLVGFFLGGLVTLGSLQAWWLQPLISKLGDFALFVGATGLTALTDNAALTYLGTLVEGLSDAAKYNLVAGAVTGGGLTVIANAPNPAGFGILKSAFGEDGISPLGLLISALIPTLVAAFFFQLLPGIG